MSKTLITSRDEKGRHYIRLCEVAYDDSELNSDQAQRLNELGGEFKAGLEKLIDELSVSGRFADEEMESKYTYPWKYSPKSIREQVEAILSVHVFENLDASWALENGQVWYDAITLPDWVECPLVYVWYEALGGYHHALTTVLEAIADSRHLHNYRDGQFTARLRQHAQTVKMEKLIKINQPGDLIIVPSQAGLRYRGCSARRARELFLPNEFGLSSVAEGCRALTHPERFVRFEDLHVNCIGDEYALDSITDFSGAPFFGFGLHDFNLSFGVSSIANSPHLPVFRNYGSSSAFLPQ